MRFRNLVTQIEDLQKKDCATKMRVDNRDR